MGSPSEKGVMTATEANAKGRLDFAAYQRDETLYADITAIGLAYRNGWRSARIAAENAAEGIVTPENEPAKAQNSPASASDPDASPFGTEPVSIFSSSNEVPKMDIVPSGTFESISRQPPPDTRTAPTSREIGLSGGARPMPTQEDVKLAIGEKTPPNAKPADPDQLSLFGP